MYRLQDISKVIDKCNEKMIREIKRSQDDLTKELETDVKRRASIPAEAVRNRGQLMEYVDSISKKSTEIHENEIISRVSSDMKVYWPKIGQDVFVGAFLEWGTGRLGETTNDYPHGFPYTDDYPWDAYTQQQYNFTGTFGIPATPHFSPAAESIKPKYYDMIRKAIRKGFK